jgi:hypothetical protein
VITCLADDLQTTFEISDNGAGFPCEDLDVIFPPYNLEDTGEARDYSLGLAFCRLAVDGHQGAIEVESVQGRGAKFTIQLPNNFEIDDAELENMDIESLGLDDAAFDDAAFDDAAFDGTDFEAMEENPRTIEIASFKATGS